MITALARWRDQLLGRGEAAITIPVFDGALKPNRILDDAETVAKLTSGEDLATDGKDLFVADGTQVMRLSQGTLEKVAGLGRTITALACIPGGGFAVSFGREVRISGGAQDGRSWTQVDGKPLTAVNAIHVRRDGTLLVTDGSAAHPYEKWCHDLMSRGKSGRLLQLDPKTNASRELASNLSYAFGVCEAGEDAWVCESWRHRIVKYGSGGTGAIVLDELPGYPSRITAASDGGFWMTVFAGRTQLVEFVLREPKYCKRMMEEIDPRYWIAPALSSGHSFLEPLQGAGVKMRGVMKPWAPPRSYGLVVKLSAQRAVEFSFHSRLDGTQHGIVSAVELGGAVFALSKGSGRILKIPVDHSKKDI